MVEEDTACPDVLVQIAAIRAALNGVGRLILEDHMQGCMVRAAQDGDFEASFRDLKRSLDQFISLPHGRRVWKPALRCSKPHADWIFIPDRFYGFRATSSRHQAYSAS